MSDHLEGTFFDTPDNLGDLAILDVWQAMKWMMLRSFMGSASPHQSVSKSRSFRSSTERNQIPRKVSEINTQSPGLSRKMWNLQVHSFLFLLSSSFWFLHLISLFFKFRILQNPPIYWWFIHTFISMDHYLDLGFISTKKKNILLAIPQTTGPFTHPNTILSCVFGGENKKEGRIMIQKLKGIITSQNYVWKLWMFKDGFNDMQSRSLQSQTS